MEFTKNLMPIAPSVPIYTVDGTIFGISVNMQKNMVVDVWKMSITKWFSIVNGYVAEIMYLRIHGEMLNSVLSFVKYVREETLRSDITI